MKLKIVKNKNISKKAFIVNGKPIIVKIAINNTNDSFGAYYAKPLNWFNYLVLYLL